jgi:hypothetical protein
MEYKIVTITIADLISLYNNGKLNLNPPYQRNDIWTNIAKKRLIESILLNYPLPLFFFHSRGNGKFDVVDGQQRIRAIILYTENEFKNLERKLFKESDQDLFLKYKLTITEIDENATETELSDFYYRVNKFGSRLNRPEIIKAQFQGTDIQNLVQNIADSEEFQALGLFKETQINRMINLDFIAEILGLTKFGINEKKNAADALYCERINETEFEKLFADFKEILEKFTSLNEIFSISETRYKQRNDFYSLWSFLHKNSDLSNEQIHYYYKILVLVGEDISPSNEKCEVFAEYALNCVTQSNSKKARIARLSFYEELFLNPESNPNKTQQDILSFYELENSSLINIENYFTLDGKMLQSILRIPEVFN